VRSGAAGTASLTPDRSIGGDLAEREADDGSIFLVIRRLHIGMERKIIEVIDVNV
jgi:hypothetical protein